MLLEPVLWEASRIQAFSGHGHDFILFWPLPHVCAVLYFSMVLMDLGSQALTKVSQALTSSHY